MSNIWHAYNMQHIAEDENVALWLVSNCGSLSAVSSSTKETFPLWTSHRAAFKQLFSCPVMILSPVTNEFSCAMYRTGDFGVFQLVALSKLVRNKLLVWNSWSTCIYISLLSLWGKISNLFSFCCFQNVKNNKEMIIFCLTWLQSIILHVACFSWRC